MTASRRSRLVLAVFGPLLVVTGVLGLVLPSRLSLLSGAVPYDLFHIGAGLVAIALIATRRERPAAWFNLVFGLVDLWQAIAGAAGWPPAQLFALGPGDHVVHVAVGTALAFVGATALRGEPRARAPQAPALREG